MRIEPISQRIDRGMVFDPLDGYPRSIALPEKRRPDHRRRDRHNVVGASSAGLPIGVCVKQAGTNDVSCRVRLNGTAVAAVPGP